MKQRDSFKLAILILGVILFLSSCNSPAANLSTATPTPLPSVAADTSLPPTTTQTSMPPAATDTPILPTATSTSMPPAATDTSEPPASTDNFPTGVLLDCPDCGTNLEGYSQIYYDDGTHIAYDRAKVELTGKWYLEGDVIHIGDTWCHDEDTMPASFNWSFDGETLTRRVIDDDCAIRRRDLQQPWRIAEVSQIPLGKYSAKKGDNIIEIGENNSFTFSEKNGDYHTSGTFSTKDREITWETDSYCDQGNSGTVTYTWYFENDVLSFHVLEKDKCSDRMGFLYHAYHKEQ